MVNKLVVTLEQNEYSALLREAIRELRTPQDQLRYIVRREFGLLPSSTNHTPTPQPTKETANAHSS